MSTHRFGCQQELIELWSAEQQVDMSASQKLANDMLTNNFDCRQDLYILVAKYKSVIHALIKIQATLFFLAVCGCFASSFTFHNLNMVTKSVFSELNTRDSQQVREQPLSGLFPDSEFSNQASISFYCNFPVLYL